MRLIYILILFIMTSCITIYNKKSLHVDKINPNDTKLKLNGYYYKEKIDSKGYSMTPMLIFANGYIHEIFTYDDTKNNPHSDFIERLFNDNYFYPLDKKFGIWGWGIWWTENDNIFIEQYCNYAGNYDIRYRYGKITSDSTFVITRDSSRFQKPNLRLDLQQYKFHKLDSKPDSINYILKNIAKFGNKNAR